MKEGEHYSVVSSQLVSYKLLVNYLPRFSFYVQCSIPCCCGFLKCVYLMLVVGVYACDVAGAVSTSRRAVCVLIILLLLMRKSKRKWLFWKASINWNFPLFCFLQLRGAKIPESDYTTLPNGLKWVYVNLLIFLTFVLVSYSGD